MPFNHLIFLIASYNRYELTRAAIAAVLSAPSSAPVKRTVVLVDDGSPDRTAERVREEFRDGVEVLEGDGSFFWAKSMAVAEDHALGIADSLEGTLVVWLNDDVALEKDALDRLRIGAEKFPNGLVVGTMVDPQSKAPTYGGFRRVGSHPLAFAIQPPGEDAINLDTLNGNLVGVPAAVARQLGGIDGGFAHAWADIDYGQRALTSGYAVILLPGVFGTCARNASHSSASMVTEWRHFTSIKGAGNPASTRRLLRRLAPNTWWFWWTATYVKWWLTRLLTPLLRRTHVSGKYSAS